jgi:hypothetical protein
MQRFGMIINKAECVLPFLDPVAVPVVPPAKAGAGIKVVSLCSKKEK